MRCEIMQLGRFLWVINFSVFIKPIFSEDAERGIGYFPKLFKIRRKEHVENTKEIPENDHERHDAILGGSEEVEKYRYLTPEEKKERLSRLVTKIDHNKDKFIDPTELFEWIANSLWKKDDEESDQVFEFIDINKDNKITWEEKLADLHKMEAIKGEKEPHENIESKIVYKKREFEAADTNGDGILDKIEYRKFSHPEDYEKMVPIIIQNLLDEIDTNKDGVIDLEEYIISVYPNKKQDKDFIDSVKEGYQNNLDINKNGILDHDEMLSLIASSSSQWACQEVTALFLGADANKDKLLSYDEVIENYKNFVHSEVTQYGEHLQNIDKIMDEL